MALINCPECKKEVSDQAKRCPHCGYKIKNWTSLFYLLNNKIIFIFGIALNILIGVIGLQLFRKGKYEMLFWVDTKRNLGEEDALYCIKMIREYTLMKNFGIVLIVTSVILILVFVIYKSYINDKNK